MSMEIAIHRSVGYKSDTHKHIVGFRGFFEDADYIYILLELCRRRVSLNTLWFLRRFSDLHWLLVLLLLLIYKLF